MAPRTSSVAVAPIPPLVERREAIRRESLRDFAGIAAGVVAGALIWLAFLALTRFPA